MVKSQKSEAKSQLHSSEPARWKVLAIALAIIVGLPLMLWGVAEYSYQQRIDRLSNAVDKLGQDSLKPVGGVETTSGTDSDCQHWLDTLKPDTGPCPGVGADWLAPIAPGQEATFIANVLTKAGYTVNVSPQSEYKPGYPFQGGHGTRQGFAVGLQLNPLGSQQPPYAAPAGTRWLQVFISIDGAKTH